VFVIGGWSATANAFRLDGSGNLTTAGTVAGTNITAAGSVTSLNSSHFIIRTGGSGNLNTDFQNTPAGTTRIQGDDAGGANGAGGAWWFYQNMRHSNGSNFWGTQVAWGWEDNANTLRTRNVSANSFGAWVTYVNSNNIDSFAKAVGVGQSWQNVRSSRNVGVAYSNSTGKPIELLVRWGNFSGVSQTLFINGVSVTNNGQNSAVFDMLSVIIPPGATYQINGILSNIPDWWELR
jgi:hypothetical protein